MGPGIRPHPASLLTPDPQPRAPHLSSSCFPAALLATSCRQAGLTAHAPDALRCHSHPLGSGCECCSSVCCARAERAPAFVSCHSKLRLFSARAPHPAVEGVPRPRLRWSGAGQRHTCQLTCPTSPQNQGHRSASGLSCWQWVSSVLRPENSRAVS